MRFHQFGQHLALRLQLAFLEGKALPAGHDLFVGARGQPERRCPVLKKLFQQSLENGWVELMFVTQTGNRNPVDQV